VGRLLSIDYGKKRCGIAVTDPMQIIATGLITIATDELTKFLKLYVPKEGVERLVVGYPLQSSGEPSENMQRIKRFVSRWQKEMPSCPVDYYDERFTSVIAHRAMIDGGLKKSRRQDKGLVDEISATIILEDYMRSRELRL